MSFICLVCSVWGPGMDCLFSFPFFLRGDGWLMVQFETLTKIEHLRSSFILNDIALYVLLPQYLFVLLEGWQLEK